MSIFASTTYLGDGSDVQAAVNELKKAGITKIELGSNHAPLIQSKLNLDKNSTYIVHNYFPPQENDLILNIASQYPQIRDKSLDFIKNSINWCHRHKISYYTIHPGFAAEAISQLGQKGKNRNFDLKFSKISTKAGKRKQTIQETLKVIAKLYELSSGKLQLLIENQGSQTSKGVTLFDSLEELQLLKLSVGHQLKFNFNLAHATLSGINLEDKKVYNYIHKNSLFFEASEIRGVYDSHLPLQAGSGRILKLLKKYKELFKKRNFILEYRNIEREKLMKSFDFVNNLLGAD